MNALKVIVFEGVQNLPIFAAQEQGFFKDQAIDIDLTFTPNSWTLRDGLAAGDYQIAHTAVDNAIAMVEQAGKDVAIVLGGDCGFNALMVQPYITQLSDLRGKNILVDAPDTAFALVMIQILRLNGMKKNDYTVTSVGATPLRLKEMQTSNAAAASIMNLPFRVLAQAHGLKNMGEAIDFVGPYLSTAGFTMRAWAQDHEDLLKRYITAYIHGLRWSLDPRHRAEVIATLMARLRLSEAVATRAYEIAMQPGGFSADGAFDLEGFKNVLRLRAATQDSWNGAEPDAMKYLELGYWTQAVSALDQTTR